MIHAVVQDSDTRVVEVLGKILEREAQVSVKTASAWDDTTRLAAARAGSVVVLGPNTTDADLAQVLRLTRDQPGTTFVQVADTVDARTLQNAMRNGIRDVVAVEDAEVELPAAVQRAHEFAIQEIPPPAARSGPAKHGRVITVFGPKGGTGKTTVATNLAVQLVESGASVVLLDASVRFGDCAAFLRLRPERTLFDLAGVPGEIDTSLIEGVLTEHSSGIRVLAAPTDALDAEKLDGDTISKAIRALRRVFDVILVDTAPALDDFTLVALAEADVAFLVTSLELPAVKNAKLCLSTLDRLHLGLEKVHIILNRANSKVGFPPDEVSRALGRDIVATLSSDVAVPRSVNNGVPVHAENRKAKIARELGSLAEQVSSDLLGDSGNKKGRFAIPAVNPRMTEA